jgi:hypothetical protein
LRTGEIADHDRALGAVGRSVRADTDIRRRRGADIQETGRKLARFVARLDQAADEAIRRLSRTRLSKPVRIIPPGCHRYWHVRIAIEIGKGLFVLTCPRVFGPSIS